MKIIRIWRGWTKPEKAKTYELFLKEEVFPSVKEKGILGLEKVSISSRNLENEVEFLLILQFDGLDSVTQFAGENYSQAYIPEKANTLLERYDNTAQHYELNDSFEL